MLPIVHLMSGLALAGFLFPFIGWKAVFIAIGSYLIDADHYFYCVFRNGEISLRKCYIWHRKDLGRDELHIFHTVEIWAIMIIASLFSDIIFFITIGMMYHLLFDFLEIYTKKLYGRRSLSITGWVKRNLG